MAAVVRLIASLLRETFRQYGHGAVLDAKQEVLMIILGGSRARELAAIALLHQLSSVRLVLLSSGSLSASELYNSVVAVAGEARPMAVVADRSAVDTVTNFTTVVEAVLCTGTTLPIAVVTDEAHAQRAQCVARVVFGAYGLSSRFYLVRGHSVAAPAESTLRCIRDTIRALLWVLTGLDGRALARLVHPRRAADSKEWEAAHRQQAAPRATLGERLRRGLQVVDHPSQPRRFDSDSESVECLVHLI